MVNDSTTNIYFHFLVEPFFFPKRTELKRFIHSKIKKAGRKVEAINYIFCTDDSLLSVNKEYLKHNFYTDIITFELSGTNQPLLADIYISVERVWENARDLNVPLGEELKRVIFHGALHLLGRKDKTAAQAAAMRKEEDAWLRSFTRST